MFGLVVFLPWHTSNFLLLWAFLNRARSHVHSQRVYWGFSYVRGSNGKKSNDGTMKMNGANAAGGAGAITKADLERLIAAAETAPAQTIRVEQGPIKIVTSDETYKM